MGTGRLPFISPRDGQTSADERRRRLMVQISRGLSATQERAIAGLSAEYRALVGRLLTPAAHKRIRVRELCRHPWIVGRQKPAGPVKGGLGDADHDAVIRDSRSRILLLNIINRISMLFYEPPGFSFSKLVWVVHKKLGCVIYMTWINFESGRILRIGLRISYGVSM